MADELHMAQLDLDVPHLLAAARDRGWTGRGRRRWDDLGYLVHQQLAALFQELAPRPFRARERGGSRWLEVLGYTSAGADRLRRRADELAEPAARSACRLAALATKPMPDSIFEPGRRFGFELRACPVVRLPREVTVNWKDGPRTFKAGAELDAYLHHRYLKQAAGNRESVYVDWLGARFGGAATLLASRLHAFRRVRLLRRGRRVEGERKIEAPERPDALFTGTLEIADPATFRTLLRPGVGRHRAFGFGMLMLRPPGR